MEKVFDSAFKKGLEGAAISNSNRSEIQQVVNRLSEEVHLASGGKIAGIRVRRIGRNSPVGVLDAIVGRQSQQFITALSAEATVKGSVQWADLCDIDFGQFGYPVTLDYDRRIVTCGDQHELEKALAEMLEDPSVGVKLLNLLNRVNAE